ncbi:MAG: hypothetical protein ABS02_01195 [Pelagibacteraceae bacterium BACL5 MAG-120813-bin20]|jgi:hypothetical protein|nr:MAG: hypothetical protein ABS02_01195 [Pelagibacteraceae bacterium BACL5 MAG-120813-bin20]
MKSLSEIDTTSKRASRASGFSWGIAEEVGKNIRLLELFGLPGIKNLTQYYLDRKSKKYEDLKIINQKNISNTLAFCPIIAGVSFLDHSKKIENYTKLIFENLAYPILFLPFLSRSSEIIGKKISLSFDENEFLLNLNVNILVNKNDNQILPLAKKLEVKILENEDSFNDEEWKNLYALSEETFVEETDSLKQSGAGAGLTDND